MTMQFYYVLQLIGVVCAYFGVTVLMPGIVLHKVLREKPFMERMLFYFLVGNYAIMNVVFVLQIFHISNRYTLICATLFPFLWLAVKNNQLPIFKWYQNFQRAFKLLVGKRLGWKTLVMGWGKRIQNLFQKAKFAWRKVPGITKTELVLVLLVIVWVLYFYGLIVLSTFGYSFSDILVHNYWVNGLSENQLFVAGIYPEGAHCIFYFLHEVFGLETYIVLSLFGLVQIFCIVFSMLIFLRSCCRNRFLPYLGLGIFLFAGFFHENTYSRYYSALPQEYGMIFLLPAIYFGFCYFKTKHHELTSDENIPTGIHNPAVYCLCGFAMSFGMTFMVHFYNTFVLALFCIAMAIGYLKLFLRKEYFRDIVVTCSVSLGIALIPMVIMFALGRPLQGSIGWGLEVIQESLGGSKTQSQVGISQYPEEGVTGNPNMNQMIDNSLDSSGTGGVSYSGTSEIINQVPAIPSKPTTWSKVKSFKNRLIQKVAEIKELLAQNVFTAYAGLCGVLLVVSLVLLLLCGLIQKKNGDICYGGMLWTMALGTGFLFLMLVAKVFGLPTLMDASRTSIYFAYMVPVVWVMAMDSLLAVLLRKCSDTMKRSFDYLAIAAGVTMAFVLYNHGMIRQNPELGYYQTNQAVTCLTNIIRTQQDNTWTIISANDETQMGLDHGYHYEIVTLLNEISDLSTCESLVIPGKKIFVFIEKKPVSYDDYFYISDYCLTEEYASKKVPSVNLKLWAYKGKNRMVCMAKTYYWVQALKQAYPNDVFVYYEDDAFICYEIDQNEYHLFDLAIDYGFN